MNQTGLKNGPLVMSAVGPPTKKVIMCQICEKIIVDPWRNLVAGQGFRTPDLYRGVDFRIEEIAHNCIKISPPNVSIQKAAFVAAIHYLRTNDHEMNSPCEIRSSNSRATAGPLCIVSRDQNNNVRSEAIGAQLTHMFL